ncbi:MAG: DUF3426 domain-containing protein [Gammaproteobacteria bacterium]|nr:DUF3426 domain-containing protein [Gammaproteobacteria bacterium]
MQTRCPECNTLFKLNESDLAIAGGKVQCGHCFHTFQAEPEQEAFKLKEEVDTSDIDINTFSEGIDDIPEEEPIPSRDIINNSGSPDLFEQNPMIDDLVPPELRHQPQNRSSTLQKFIWSIAIMSFALTAFMQLIYFKRTELASKAELRPYMLSLCEFAQCDIPELKDISRLELSSKNVYSHPNVDKALMITAVIVNQAAFAQQFPTLQISFTNLVGDIVMARQFKPGEYLNTSEDKLSDMQPGLPIQITLEVLDPGNSATAYEFSFI